MKKLLLFLLTLALLVSAAGCTAAPQNSSSSESVSSETSGTEGGSASLSGETIRLAALKGPTALGMLQLLTDAADGKTADTYEVTLAGAADEILGSIIQGNLDIAAVPANVASVLYNKTEGKVQMGAINTLGVLYILEKGDTIHSIADLKGKTIYAHGQGATPEYALNYILTKNGLTPGEDVTVEFKSEASEVGALIASGEVEVAMLPQPFVTSVLMQNEGWHVALDMTEEWNKVGDGSSLVMGCIVVQKAFAEAHPEALERFMDAYASSVAFSNEHVEEAAQMAEALDILKAGVVQKALPQCHIVFIDGAEMKEKAGGYLAAMFEADPASVGGALPGDDFYLSR